MKQVASCNGAHCLTLRELLSPEQQQHCNAVSKLCCLTSAVKGCESAVKTVEGSRKMRQLT